MSDIAIEINDLTVQFESVTAVDGLDLEVKWGELVGLLGPNGAGKTTTVNVLSTLLMPTDGSVRVGGHDVLTEADRIRELIGLCPQEPAFYPYLTGRENIELFGALHSIPKKELQARVDMLINKIGMEDHANRRAREYSGGMVRRVSTLMALVHNPQIALLDEPTVAMDPVSRRAVWDFIRELKNSGKAVILTTHYMEEAQELCDRVAVIDSGKLVALGSPEELMRKHGAENLEDVFIELTGKKLKEEV